MRNGTWIFCLSVSLPWKESFDISLFMVSQGVLLIGEIVSHHLDSWRHSTIVPYSFRHPPSLSTLLVVPFSTSSQGSLSSSSFNSFLNNCRNRPCEWKFHRYPSSSSCASFSSVGQTGRHLETDEAITAERGTHPLQGLIKRIKRPLGRV